MRICINVHGGPNGCYLGSLLLRLSHLAELLALSGGYVRYFTLPFCGRVFWWHMVCVLEGKRYVDVETSVRRLFE